MVNPDNQKLKNQSEDKIFKAIKGIIIRDIRNIFE